MDHVAILRKAKIKKGDNLLGDILNGNKTIESRWYVNKINPWNKITENDRVFFKESGCFVTAVARVSKVIQYEILDKETINKIIQNYGNQISPQTSESEFQSWAAKESNKRYCILVFLKDVKEIDPININKKGFGISSAWMCVGDIESVKIR